MFNIPNFQITQSLYDSENSLIYRAIRQIDQQPVILKWLKADYPTVTQLARYQHEYELLTHLTLPGVILVYGLEQWQDHLILVLEDLGGESLNLWLKQRTFTVTECLSLAIQIADGLGQIHAANVIHKDINPANIVWNPTTGQLKLIDFGIATRLPRETLALQNPNQLEGTLPYLSPEQTGRMNRALDYRTDLYSLGVTFYEMFTGRLPFETQEAMELVHCHLAKEPIPPHQRNTEVPPVISHLIRRLMAKAAEKRYQSAWGVKADLEQIRSNLTGLQDLSGFQLGQHDFSDRFHLPQKLYGREAELQQLLATFEEVTTGASQLLLVAGYSGIGKTALVQEIYRPITEKRGYFIAGKFDQFQRNVPYSAVVQAFGDLMRQLLTETQVQLDSWKTEILTAVGNNGQVIIDVIPEVELILGPQPVVPTLPPTESQNRFNLVFQNFLQVVCQPTHPLVMFLDDLQWVDAASLKLMTLMMNDIPYLLLIGAYRDNEVSPVHPLMTTLEEMQKQGLLVQTLTLTPLTLPHLNQLVSDTLHLPVATTLPLTDLVMAKTGGNPFFVGEFLKTLHVEQLLDFNRDLRQWQWDLTQIQAHNITDNVVELMTGKIRRLQPSVQQMLTLAAAIGNQFELATLATVSQQSREWVKTTLWEALVEGLVVPIGETYKFVHDRVQQAAYTFIAEDQKPALHLQIGRLLLANSPELEKSEKLFEIVDHLNLGLQLVTTPEELHAIIHWNLIAGRKAKIAAAYEPAVKYLQCGLDWLTADSWKTQYALTLDLYVEAVESYYLNTQFEKSQQLAEIALHHTHLLLEKIKIYEVLIQSYVAQNQLQRSLDTSLAVLAMLDVTLVEQPPAVSNVAELIDLPAMTAPDKLAAMRILNFATSTTYAVAPTLFPKIAFTLVDLSIKHGNSSLSAFGYSLYGMLLCAVFDNIEEGYRFGRLSIQLLDKFAAQEFKAKVFACTYSTITLWKQHLKESLAPLQETIQSGLNSGDREFACLATMYYCSHFFWLGHPLETVTQTLSKYLDLVQQANQEYQQVYINIWAQLALNLQTPTAEPGRLIGSRFNEDHLLPTLLATNYGMAIISTYLAKTTLNYWFEDYPQAVTQGQLADSYTQAHAGAIVVAIHNFYYSLAMLAHYSQVDSSEQHTYLTIVTANQAKMQYWAAHAPWNYQHKYDLVEAERARILEQFEQAAKGYEKAIAGAKENEYLQEEALAYELAARFYLSHGMDKFAHTYLTEAYQRYQRWGALAKLQHLEEQYPQWLPPHQVTVAPVTTTLATTRSMTRLNTTRVATGTDWLDLASVMKAAQVLSGEIVLEKLLDRLMRIVIENAGAQRGFLLLPQAGQWFIEAQGAVDQEEVRVLQSLPVDTHLPDTMVNYVIRTQEPLVLAEAKQDGRYAGHPYIQAQQIQSVLCFPILHQQQLRAILYLENNLTPGAFTPDRLQMLTMLSGQIAISLENAQVMAHLDAKVKERTAQLNAKIEELTQTREGLMQSEKMASLGRLVAGFAHELNTPIGVAVGSASALQREAQTIRHLMTQEEVDVDELLAAVTSVENGFTLTLANLERAANLVTSFKRTAVDQTSGEVRTFRVGEVIEDTINTLHTHFKQTSIQIQVTCPHELKVKSLPGALEQILTNLLMNSLIHGFEEGQRAGQIQIAVQLQETQLHLEYSDNGKGIASENLAKIFEPFFTTHRAHGGSGLGMYICYNLITSQLQGAITVGSVVGEGVVFRIDYPVSVN